MNLKRLRLQDYRNYAQLDLTALGPLNIFVGENAQGKSNLLEAIYVLATGRSHRGAREGELIRWGAAEASVLGVVGRQTGDTQLELAIRAAGPKRLTVNGKGRRLTDLFGVAATVVFSPDDLRLVKGPPDERRRFLDLEIAQVSAVYRHHLVRYHKILRQRNTLLRAIAAGEADVARLAEWDPQLLESGVEIIIQRARAVRRLSELAGAAHRAISAQKEALELRYVPFWEVGEGARGQKRRASALELEERAVVRPIYAEELKRLRRVETIRGSTLCGPHRDDLEFVINGVDARRFGSQGQQRSAVLAAKLGEVAFMREELGEPPMLLLDDVLSELDAGRRHQFVEQVSGRVQTFITTAYLAGFPEALLAGATRFRIAAGRVTAE
ncbi:MAG TPA: DNA replication/repair protein RecF [Limnochordia bacterium]